MVPLFIPWATHPSSHPANPATLLEVQSGAKLDVDSADFFQRTVDAPKVAMSRQGGA